MKTSTSKELTPVEFFADEVLRSRQLGFISNEKFKDLIEHFKEMDEHFANVKLFMAIDAIKDARSKVKTEAIQTVLDDILAFLDRLKEIPIKVKKK